MRARSTGMRTMCGGMLLAALLLLLLSQAGAAQAAQKQGPLVISGVEFDQKKLRGKIDLRTRGSRIPYDSLQTHPERVFADGRHLCLAISGAGVKRRLFCVGAKVKKGSTRVGVSRYFKNGRTVKRPGFKSEIARPAPNRIKLRFDLDRAGFDKGRLSYFAVSSWRGQDCPPAGGDGPVPGISAAKPTGPCQDRAPRAGVRKARIVPVERVGCTTGDLGIFRNGSRSKKRVALTFDDGPSSYTARILDDLNRLDAKGTFFHVGTQMGGQEGLMRKIVADGHEMANHSWAHEQLPSSSSMRATTKRIRSATGFKPCTFRPPYGLFNSGTVSSARANDMSVALWDIDTSDYNQPGSGAIYSRAVQAGPGSIVLMHDGGGPRGQTVDAVPRIVKTLQSRGYELVTVTELMGGRFKLREKR